MTDLEHVLCHRPPMIFLDDVIETDQDRLVAIIRIREGIPFYKSQRGVPTWIGLEYMAQSIAALAGIRARNAGKPVPLGMIIGCRNYTCNTSMFPPGSELQISIKELAAEEYGFGSFDCKIEGPDLAAQARVSVFGGDRQAAV
jgi:predicted hotdog family 3-hydroxylacyl-ACP dehydratase